MPAHAATCPNSETFDLQRAPGHWVLARLGKRVLRPGGLEATSILLDSLSVTSEDRVVEFAPGLGITARRLLARHPASYTGIERDEAAARSLTAKLTSPTARFVNAPAQGSGLPGESCDVVVGEALLTMQPVDVKRAIIREASRLLAPGGRFGMHEIALQPEDIPDPVRQEIRARMSQAIHHGVMAQTESEWRALLSGEGLGDIRVHHVPFRLLEPARLLADEGFAGALRFAFNLCTMPEARRRVLQMRRTFRRHQAHLTAIIMTARKAG